MTCAQHHASKAQPLQGVLLALPLSGLDGTHLAVLLPRLTAPIHRHCTIANDLAALHNILACRHTSVKIQVCCLVGTVADRETLEAPLC